MEYSIPPDCPNGDRCKNFDSEHLITYSHPARGPGAAVIQLLFQGLTHNSYTTESVPIPIEKSLESTEMKHSMFGKEECQESQPISIPASSEQQNNYREPRC